MGRPEIYEIVTENFSLQAIKDIAVGNVNVAKELLANTEGKSQEVVESLKAALEEVENMLINGAAREEIFSANKALENAIKEYTEYTEDIKPENPGNNGNGENNGNNGSNGNNGNETKPENQNKPGNLPNTGSPISPVGIVGLGAIISAIGALLFKRRK